MKRDCYAAENAGVLDSQVPWITTPALLSLHSFKAKDNYMLS